MESKNKFWKGVLVGALVMAFAGLVIVGVSAGIFLIGKTVMDQPAQIVEESSVSTAGEGDLDFDRITEKMDYIQSIVSQYYLFEEDPERVEDGIYMGLMYGLNDPYSVYYNEKDYQSMLEDTSGEYCGIGAMVSQNRSTGIATVIKVFENAPAFEAGMLPGDIIYKVEGEDVTGIDLDLLISNYIRGEEGSRVKLTVLRGDSNEEVDLSIERRQIEIPTVEHEMLEDQVGYIYVMQFDQVTGQQFKTAVDDLESQGMEKLIVDLRDNPGGLLDAVVEMLAYVLPEDKMEGMLVYTADKDGKGDRFFCKDGTIQYESDYRQHNSAYPVEDNHELDIPLAVLVNGNSASASEVFTGAIQDYEAGVVVGTQTFGKGIVQSLLPLGDGTAIKLTTAHYYTPSGFDLHGVGLAPDVEVDLDEELKTKAVVEKSEDNQLMAAIEALDS
ncbi:MAG: S41 family peptidase [Hungatella sp.]|nr:S41 family peptidase [Hungatella sp.]